MINLNIWSQHNVFLVVSPWCRCCPMTAYSPLLSSQGFHCLLLLCFGPLPVENACEKSWNLDSWLDEIMSARMEPLVVKVRVRGNGLCSMKMKSRRSGRVFQVDSWNTKGIFMEHTQCRLIALYISQLIEQQTLWKQERFRDKQNWTTLSLLQREQLPHVWREILQVHHITFYSTTIKMYEIVWYYLTV